MNIDKKSQIGVFILLSLILVIGFGFVMLLKNSGIKQASVSNTAKTGRNTTKTKNNC